MTEHFQLGSEADTARLARAIAPFLKPGDCLKLEGTLGAGKTTFMRHLLAALHHEGEVLSPTFLLVQDYDVTLADGTPCPLYHLDCYRMEDPAELVELGLGEMLQQGIVCVEWPQVAAEQLPKQAIHLTLTVVGEEMREAVLDWPQRNKEQQTPTAEAIEKRILAGFHEQFA